MARTTILEYLDNFRLHGGETAYVHRRGYRVAALDLWRGAEHRLSLCARAGSARYRQGRQGPHLGRELRRVDCGFSSDACCAARSSFPSTRSPPPTSRSASRSKSTPSCASAPANQFAGVAALHLETLRDEIAARSDSPVTPPAAHPRRHRGDRLHLRHNRRAARRRHLARKHPGEPGTAGARDRQLPQVRAHLPSAALSESAAAQPRLRTVSGNLPAAAAGGDGDLPGHAEPFGGAAGHQEANACRSLSPCRG